MDKKYVLEEDCKELRNEAYKNLEFIVSASETALVSEIRHSEMRTKAYVDLKTKETNDRLTKLEEQSEKRHNDLKAYIDQKLEVVIDAIKSVKT
jgi:hypothetical protein